ncbi:IL-6 subfamily cytokine M17 [Fundulus heteroclitus]|uniref:IL-6 subfamily cytokine M17 n=1 Tax=Fundulus heteroclitus TaxID=8078 RepID=UPI00165C3415|nr:IL-6 subfamily cytokine M17 [Fundulus heteroclitus]
MNGHVKSMNFQQRAETAATLLCFLLLLAVDSTKTVAAARNRECSSDLERTLRLTKLIHRQTGVLIKTYKAFQGEMGPGVCKATGFDVPDPNISGLEPSERMASMYTHLQAFSSHLKRVQEQQTDLQLPGSIVLRKINESRVQNKRLSSSINSLYHTFFPNLPLPEPAGGPTTLPPPQTVFQQKIYGCVVLTTYKVFLANMSKNVKTLKSKMCRKAPKSTSNSGR